MRMENLEIASVSTFWTARYTTPHYHLTTLREL